MTGPKIEIDGARVEAMIMEMGAIGAHRGTGRVAHGLFAGMDRGQRAVLAMVRGSGPEGAHGCRRQCLGSA